MGASQELPDGIFLAVVLFGVACGALVLLTLCCWFFPPARFREWRWTHKLRVEERRIIAAAAAAAAAGEPGPYGQSARAPQLPHGGAAGQPEVAVRMSPSPRR
jgi:hypothetical protein